MQRISARLIHWQMQEGIVGAILGGVSLSIPNVLVNQRLTDWSSVMRLVGVFFRGADGRKAGENWAHRNAGNCIANLAIDLESRVKARGRGGRRSQ